VYRFRHGYVSVRILCSARRLYVWRVLKYGIRRLLCQGDVIDSSVRNRMRFV
jgi:hypothetical protein